MRVKRKYQNIPTVAHGYKFDSKREAARYGELRLLELAGEIYALKRQPIYSLVVNGFKICTYRPDFDYRKAVDHALVVEDVKSKPSMTAVYRLKKKLMVACHNIQIQEIL